jgi:hypothetical protein
MEDDHVEAPLDGVSGAEFLIKPGPSSLCHDGAIERVDGSGVEPAAKQP